MYFYYLHPAPPQNQRERERERHRTTPNGAGHPPRPSPWPLALAEQVIVHHRSGLRPNVLPVGEAGPKLVAAAEIQENIWEASKNVIA